MATTTTTSIDASASMELQFTPGGPPRRAFEDQHQPDGTSKSVVDDHQQVDLMGHIPIYTMWMKKFSEDPEAAQEEWKSFRQDALERYNDLDRTLRSIEDELNVQDDLGYFLDLSVVLEKQSTTDILYTKFEQSEEAFSLVTKLLEEFAAFLPKEIHRAKVDAMNRLLRRRFFELLQHLHRKKRLFRWLVPRLQRYRRSGSDVKAWLDKVESLAETLIPDSKGSMLHLEESVGKLVREALEMKSVYEDFVSGGKGMECVRVELNETFGVNITELKLDLDDVVQRWDAMCATLENLTTEITKEKTAPKKPRKMPTTDAEKIDLKLEEEVQLCTCESPFKIHKVGDGKYTFGSSKIIRLVRINGNSIVVRVGGGWEYVYNFLMKVDPCRAQEFAPGKIRKPSNVNDAIQATGVTLTPLDKQESTFTMSVQRLRSVSVTPVGGTSGRSSRASTPLSIEEVSVDSTDGEPDVASSVSDVTTPRDSRSDKENVSKSSPPSGGRSTPALESKRRPSSPAPCRSSSCKSNPKNGARKPSSRTTIPRTNLKNAKSESNLSPSKAPVAVCESGLTYAESTPDLPSEPTLKKSSNKPKRLSLLDRQNSYAQKRRSMINLPTAVDS